MKRWKCVHVSAQTSGERVFPDIALILSGHVGEASLVRCGVMSHPVGQSHVQQLHHVFYWSDMLVNLWDSNTYHPALIPYKSSDQSNSSTRYWAFIIILTFKMITAIQWLTSATESFLIKADLSVSATHDDRLIECIMCMIPHVSASSLSEWLCRILSWKWFSDYSQFNSANVH